MKSAKFQRRFYRGWLDTRGLEVTHIIAKETDLQILTNKALDKDFVSERIKALRWEIETYITRDRRFLTALKPLKVDINAAGIIKEMSLQAEKANVGPMACVAGAVAESLGRDLLKKGYKEVIVENGGDIFLKINQARSVGLYAGGSKLWNKLKLKIKPKDSPLGICASSGTIGHSLSFGCADLVIILSKNTALADAVATATANRVNSQQDLQRALDFARGVKGVLAAIIILGNNLISWGKIEFSK